MSTLKTPPIETESGDLNDPVLRMVGVGKEIWEQEPGDRFVSRLRSEELDEVPVHTQAAGASSNLLEAVWSRIEKNQGERFQTRKGLSLTYKVEGNGIWFFRDGERINRKLTRTQVEEAISRCPLRSTTEIKDLMDYPYLFAILMDPRIRAQAW